MFYPASFSFRNNEKVRSHGFDRECFSAYDNGISLTVVLEDFLYAFKVIFNLILRQWPIKLIDSIIIDVDEADSSSFTTTLVLRTTEKLQ